MAYEKGVNVNVLAESGQTDEETIEMYEGKVPGRALESDEYYNKNIGAVKFVPPQEVRRTLI